MITCVMQIVTSDLKREAFLIIYMITRAIQPVIFAKATGKCLTIFMIIDATATAIFARQKEIQHTPIIMRAIITVTTADMLGMFPVIHTAR